jgi:MFS family permease
MTSLTRLWQNPKFTRLWSARLVSRFGSALSYIVLIWIAYTETGSALAVTYVGLAEFVPTIAVGIFTGALVDRFDRRQVIVLSVLGRSAAMAALAVTLYLVGFHLAFVLLAVVVFTILSTFFGPASQALLPEIVSPESLADANGLFESSESVVGIIASSLGGVFIVIVGAVPSLGIDAASYLVAALFVALIGATVISTPATQETRGLLQEVRDGFVYLRRNVGLFELTLAALLLNFLFAAVLTYLVVYATGPLRGGAVVFAVLEATLAAGVAVGAILVGRLRLTRYTGRMWVYAAFGQAVGVLGLVFFPVFPVAFSALFAFGVMNGILNISWLSTVQVIVPERMQGRYFAIDNMLSLGAIPVAQIVFGVLILAEGVSNTFLWMGVGSLVAGVGFLFLKDLHRLGYTPKTEPADG